MLDGFKQSCASVSGRSHSRNKSFRIHNTGFKFNPIWLTVEMGAAHSVSAGFCPGERSHRDPGAATGKGHRGKRGHGGKRGRQELNVDYKRRVTCQSLHLF